VNRLKTVLMVLTLVTAVSLSVVGDDASDQARQTATVYDFQVTSRKYEFGPSSLRVKKGDHLRLVIVALDHDHGFRLDEFHINNEDRKGKDGNGRLHSRQSRHFFISLLELLWVRPRRDEGNAGGRRVTWSSCSLPLFC
jgi:plastocyanin